MRFCKMGETVQYGYSLNDFYEMLDLMGVVDDDFNLFQFLLDKGEITEDGEVKGKIYGLVHCTEKTDKGLFNTVEESYIFIPATGIRKFIKEVNGTSR